MPTTDTFMQMADRMVIARLKAFHYGRDDKPEAAKLAQAQADALAVAAETYLYECLSGQRRPMVRPHLRYHDHGKVEGAWAGKTATGDGAPRTVTEAIAGLADTHAEYWSLQTKVQALKRKIDDCPPSDLATVNEFNDEFVKTQRRIDLLNQVRNERVNQGDELLARQFEEAGK